MRGITIMERVISLAQYIIDSKDTVRGAAKKFCISKSTVHKDITERLGEINPALAKEVRKILDEIINSNFEPQTITKIILMSIKIMGKRNFGNNLTYSAIWNTYNNNLDKIISGLGYANGQSKYIYAVKEKGKKKEAIMALVNTSHELFGNVDCILFAIKDIFKFRFLEESVFYLKQFQIYEPYPILKTEEIEIYEKTLQEIQEESEKK